MSAPVRIVIIQTAFLGDMLLCIPTILNIKKIFKNCFITIICRKGVGGLIQGLQLVDEVLEVDKKNKNSLNKLNELLSEKKFEILFCPHESFRSSLLANKARADVKIGFYKWWNFFAFHKRIKRDLELPDALRQLSLLSEFEKNIESEIKKYKEKRMNVRKLSLNSLIDRIFVPNVSSMGLKKHILNLNIHKDLLKKYGLSEGAIFLAPGSVWNTKRWTIEGYVELAKKLVRTQTVILIGSPDERNLCEKIHNEVQDTLNLAGQPSLFELQVILATGKALVCNDSGSMHMGSVAEIPTVSIFGPTVLEIGYQPWQDKSLVVENTELSCRPCGLHGHKNCPIGTHECMKSISASKVEAALLQVLS